jgi:Xaa-Pro aminopeptidase
MDYRRRVLRLRRKLKDLTAILVTSSKNIRYLTGFTGSAGFVILRPEGDLFVTDFRYKEQSALEVNAMEVHIETKGMTEALKAMLKGRKLRKLGIEPLISFALYSELRDAKLNPHSLEDSLERMRMIKDKEELVFIKEAIRRAEDAFLDIKPYIKAGVTERGIALRLERRMKELGSGELPFPIIVASGANSAKPHAGASEKKLKKGDLLTIDWGAEADGYCSDMTRTLLIAGGSDMAKKKKIYSIVKRANRAALKALGPGVGLKAIDGVARSLIVEKGYGEYFGHGLGHGVGLDVHEGPRLSPKGSGRAKKGMVVTIEPGIYIPEMGGVRIEDMAVVTENGKQILTKLPVELEIIG